MSIIERKPAQPNQSIVDALSMLQTVVAADGPVGCTQLAREYGLDVTRVNRILGTLAYAGLLARTRSRKYVPGAGVHVLGVMGLHKSDLIQCAESPIRSLERKTRMMVTLGLLWRQYVTIIQFTGAPRADSAPTIRSGLLPVQESLIGQVLLAQYSDSEIRDYFARYTKRGEVKITPLLRNVNQARRNNYAVGDNHRVAAVAVGAPAVAGLAVSSREKQPAIPAKSLPDVVEQLHSTAQAIAEELAARKAS